MDVPLRWKLDPDTPENVTAALVADGWIPTAGEDWNLWWATHRPPDGAYRTLDRGQLINHVLGAGALGDASELHAMLAAAAARAARRRATVPGDAHVDRFARFAFLPPAFRLPEEERVRRPQLLDGLPCSLRLYLLVSALDPLCAHLHRDGVVHGGSSLAGGAAAQDMTLTAWRARLRSAGIDDVGVWRALKDLASATAAAVRDRLLAEHRRADVGSDNGFELLGLDVVLDEDFAPWLIACNDGPLTPHPDGAPGAHDEVLRAAVIADVVRVVRAALTRRLGEAEGAVASAEQRGAAGRAQVEEAVDRFERVFPPQDPGRGLELLPFPRSADVALARGLMATGGGVTAAPEPQLVANQVTTLALGDDLVLHEGRTRTLHVLNPAAAYLWSALSQGLGVAEMVRELASAVGDDDASTVERDVRAALADWLHDGLLVDAGGGETPRDATVAAAPATTGTAPGGPTAAMPWNEGHDCRLHGRCVRVLLPGKEVEARVGPVLAAFEPAPSDSPLAHDGVVEVLVRDQGFRVLSDAGLLLDCAAEALPSTLMAAVERTALRSRAGIAAIRGTLVSSPGAGTSVVLLDPPRGAPSLSRDLLASLETLGWRRRGWPTLLCEPGAPGAASATPAAVAGDEPTAGTGAAPVGAVVFHRPAPAVSLAPLTPVGLLRRMLRREPGLAVGLEAREAELLVEWIGAVRSFELSGSHAGEAARLLAVTIDAEHGAGAQPR